MIYPHRERRIISHQCELIGLIELTQHVISMGEETNIELTRESEKQIEVGEGNVTKLKRARNFCRRLCRTHQSLALTRGTCTPLPILYLP